MDLENRRTTKEINLPNDGYTKIKTKYGTLDKNNPEILYIRSRATVTPTISKKDFSEDISNIKKSFEKNVKTVMFKSDVFEDKYICSIEMSENGIAFGKKSHMKYDVYVKPKINKTIDEYISDVQSIVYCFNQNITELLTKNNIKVG